MQPLNLENIYDGTWMSDVDLTDYTWLRLNGSRSKLLWFPSSPQVLAEFIKDNSISYLVLGNGSNTLLGSFDGVIIRTVNLNKMKFDGEYIIAEAGISNSQLVSYCIKHGKCGFEFLYTIPGTVGASICMNAGAHGSEIGEYVAWVEVIDKTDGSIKSLQRSDIEFTYRNSSLQGRFIVTKAALATRDVEQSESIVKVKQYQDYIAKKQPRTNTLGSTFKNQGDIPAWRLIDELPKQYLTSKNLHFSELHRNFMINDGAGTASEARDLAHSVKKKVFEQSGIELEFEIKIYMDGKNDE